MVLWALYAGYLSSLPVPPHRLVTPVTFFSSRLDLILRAASDMIAEVVKSIPYSSYWIDCVIAELHQESPSCSEDSEFDTRPRVLCPQ